MSSLVAVVVFLLVFVALCVISGWYKDVSVITSLALTILVNFVVLWLSEGGFTFIIPCNWSLKGVVFLLVELIVMSVLARAISHNWHEYNNSMQKITMFVLICYGFVASMGMTVLNLVTYHGRDFLSKDIPTELPYLGILFFLMNFGTLLIIPMILSGLQRTNKQ